jgi:hypothetical protein
MSGPKTIPTSEVSALFELPNNLSEQFHAQLIEAVFHRQPGLTLPG